MRTIALLSYPRHFEEDENRLLALIPLPLPARRWKSENLEILVWDKDEIDEIDECIELAACELVLQIYFGENDIDHVLAGLALYLLGKAGVTIDESENF